MTPRRRQGILILLFSSAVTLIFVIDLCNAIYSCGCRPVWAGAAVHCNIHKSGVKHCPWCSIGSGGFAVLLGFLIAPQAFFSFRPTNWGWKRRLGMSLLMFPVAGIMAGLGLGWALRYWI